MLRTVIPVGMGRLVHVVVYGFQGADCDPEKLTRTDQLFQAVLCEIRVVDEGHPHLVQGAFNIEPLQNPLFGERDFGGLAG